MGKRKKDTRKGADYSLLMIRILVILTWVVIGFVLVTWPEQSPTVIVT